MKPNDSELTETRLVEKGSATGSIIGALIGVIIFIALITTIVFVVRKQRMNRDGPPSHKPPPPMKVAKTSYNAMQPPVSDTHNNVPLEYYETQRVEPVTDLDSYQGDDDDQPKPFYSNSGPDLEDSEILPPYYEFRDTEMDADEQHLSPSSLSREDSFMSAPMIV